MTDYTPELDKVAEARETGDPQIIGEFLEWAGVNGYSFTKNPPTTGIDRGQSGTPVEIDDVLAHFFGIDLKKAEEERQALRARLQMLSACQRGATP